MSLRRGPRAWVVALALTTGAVGAWMPEPAQAQGTMFGEGRRPGLGGRYTRRSITLAQNALYVMAGPWAPMLLGQRVNGYGIDAGFQLTRPGGDALAGLPEQGTPDEVIFDTNLGVGFGLFENFEAGALFLSFTWTPDFNFGGFPVFLTTWWELGPVDLGLRVVWISFLDDPQVPDTRQTTLNMSAPIVVHLGTSRIDTGVFFPIGFRELPFNFRWADDDGIKVAPGLSIPLRYSYNPIPEVILGLETGFYDDDLTVAEDLSMPLGGFVGGTILLGDRLLDVGVLFQWDHFLRPGAPEDVDTLQTAFWRVTVGANLSRVVL